MVYSSSLSSSLLSPIQGLHHWSAGFASSNCHACAFSCNRREWLTKTRSLAFFGFRRFLLGQCTSAWSFQFLSPCLFPLKIKIPYMYTRKTVVYRYNYVRIMDTEGSQGSLEVIRDPQDPGSKDLKDPGSQGSQGSPQVILHSDN